MQNITETDQVRLEAECEREARVHFLEPLIVLAKRKSMIVRTTVAAIVVACVIVLLIPNRYQATTKLMPPQQSQSVAAAMLGQLGPLASMAGKDLGLKNPTELYVTMLGSRTVADALINRFDLQKAYRVKRMVESRERLAAASDISAGRDGVISITVEDRDPKRAAELANGYVEELTNVTHTLAVTEAGQRRLFFEQRLQQAREELARAEQELQKTQESTGIVQLDSQAKAMIESAALLRAQIAAKQVQLNAMDAFATAQNPDRVLVEQEIAGLRRQLRSMQQSTGNDELGVPIGKVPSAGLEYVRKMRELKYHESVFELMAKQYELAKVDEGKSPVIIQVLDKAVQPEKKSAPNRALIVLGTALVAAFLSMLAAFVFEAVQQMASDKTLASRVCLLKAYLLGSNKGGQSGAPETRRSW